MGDISGKGPLDGVLLLQCVGRHFHEKQSTCNALMSYEWDDTMKKFVVETRDRPNQARNRDNMILTKVLDKFSTADVDFYVLWIDHNAPPFVGTVDSDNLPDYPDDTSKSNAFNSPRLSCADGEWSAGLFTGMLTSGAISICAYVIS